MKPGIHDIGLSGFLRPRGRDATRIHWPRFQGDREALRRNGQLDFKWLLTDPTGVKRATRWWLRRNIVDQFRLANQLIKDG
ncbi:hypothetical protein VTN49DRAFT_3998 [Thermomyces lanuginosus]|uniref:uncharacterized protein n=1 Tax=Thermomyces lanuginosus TaxID=5541 RepID=UPI0037433598